MDIDTFPQQPLRRKRRSTAELLEAARKVEEKAVERAVRKRRNVQKYESVQRSRERKLDTRRKVIAGALALEHAQRDNFFNRALMGLLSDYVIRDEERALFGLAPLPSEERDKLLAEQQAKTRKRRRPA